jgi:hypothetical protein
MVRTKSAGAEVTVAQEKCEAAALAYQPETYEGKVLLLLASERPPHVNILPRWQAVLPRDLHTQYLDGRHSDLLKAENVRSVADAIVSCLIHATDDKSLYCCADTPDQTSLVQTDGRDQCMVLDKDEGDRTWRSTINAIDSMNDEEAERV